MPPAKVPAGSRQMLKNMASLTFGLTLVRHGETQYNKDGLLQGQAIDSSLSEIGMQQAEAAGLYLKEIKFSDVFSSDMLRARQTAEVLMKHNSSCSGLGMMCDPLLKERSFGVAEGGTVQAYREMAKAAGEPLPDFTPPQGETLEQVKHRVKEFFGKMLQQMGSKHWSDQAQGEHPPQEPFPIKGEADDGLGGVSVHVLVSTHGAYLRVAVRYLVEELQCWLPQGSDRAHMFSLSPNTGISRFLLTVRKEGDGFRLSGVRCVFVNRGDHVQQ